MKPIVEHPIVHFLVAGLVLFVLFEGRKDRGAERSLITVDRDALLTQLQFRATAFDREMAERELASQSEVELRRMIDDYVREEALYREAKALGLAEDDEVIRGRLVQKLEFILEGFAPASVDPNSGDVAEYFEAHRHDYTMGPYLTFAHVFFRKANRSRDECLATAEAKLGELNRKAVPFDEAGQHGETFRYHTKYFGKTPGHIASQFGTPMSEAIFELGPDDRLWRGPFESPDGFHLVMVTENQPKREPELGDVEHRVREDMRRAAVRRTIDAAVEDIATAYEIRIVAPRAKAHTPMERLQQP